MNGSQAVALNLSYGPAVCHRLRVPHGDVFARKSDLYTVTFTKAPGTLTPNTIPLRGRRSPTSYLVELIHAGHSTGGRSSVEPNLHELRVCLC